MTEPRPRITDSVLRIHDQQDAECPNGDAALSASGFGGVCHCAAVPGIVIADSYVRRLRGMLGRRTLPAGLLLVPGGSVHGVGMTRRLDVALLVPVGPDADRVSGPHRVVRTAVLWPFGVVLSSRGVRAVLEAPHGSFDRWGLTPGDILTVESSGR